MNYFPSDDLRFLCKMGGGERGELYLLKARMWAAT